MPIGSNVSVRDLLDGFIDGVEPPFCFVRSSHPMMRIEWNGMEEPERWQADREFDVDAEDRFFFSK